MLDCHVSHNRDHFSVLVDEEQEYFRWQSEKIVLLFSTLHDLTPGGTRSAVACFTVMATEAFRSTGFRSTVAIPVKQSTSARVPPGPKSCRVETRRSAALQV